jgi:hypothetical protein
MANRDIYIIKNAAGEIIAASLPDDGADVSTSMTPIRADQTLYRISDVPSEIYQTEDPNKFFSLITEHVDSGRSKPREITSRELTETIASHLGSARKK